MRHHTLKPILIALGLLSPLLARGQLQLVPALAAQALFSGQTQLVHVTFHNPADTPVELNLRTRVYQASSATAMPVGQPQEWKRLTVLPGQTVLESAVLAFPPVRAATRFIVQWLESTNQVLGVTDVLAYPPGVLKDLKPLCGGAALGVLDPQNQLKPLLSAAAVEFRDLEDIVLDDFRGRLVIAGPFESPAQMRTGLAQSLESLARRGVGVIWIQSQSVEPREMLVPSFYCVEKGQGAIVVVQAGVVADLRADPQAQLNLVLLARLALHPQPFSLPNFDRQP